MENEEGDGGIMKETSREYIERMLGHIAGQDPRRVQAWTAAKLGRVIKGVPRSKLRKRPAPEKWSVVEILAHLADSEIVIGWRMRQILGAPGTMYLIHPEHPPANTGSHDPANPQSGLQVVYFPSGVWSTF